MHPYDIRFVTAAKDLWKSLAEHCGSDNAPILDTIAGLEEWERHILNVQTIKDLFATVNRLAEERNKFPENASMLMADEIKTYEEIVKIMDDGETKRDVEGKIKALTLQLAELQVQGTKDVL